ncbi:MAG TPA: calcium-binding protein, partial [Actinomycetota bacterium]|nr:calcium-binding protein [Actinomycetota bacterium]
SSTGVTLDLGAGHASGPGTDTLSSIENVNGSRLDDSLTGSDRANYLVGELGNDTINAGAGEDVIQPGSYGELTPDDDTIDGGSEVDLFQFWDAGHAITIDFSEGIATGEGTDHFTGMEGMTDSPHDDTIHGSDGDEIFIAYEGNDTIDGRGGFDILAYWLSDNPVTVDLEAGTASGYGRDSIAGIEAAWGSNDRRNEMYGDAGNNILWGGEVDDKIYGRGGDDYIGGFIGDDLFDGGDGAFDIGTFCAPCTPAIRADMRTNKVTGPGDVTLVGIEAIEGSPSDDVIFGNDATNWIYGLTGDDKINGLGGDDFLAGDQGEDKADGGDGDDNCYSTENPLSCESVHGGGESLTCIPVLAVRACQNEGDPDAPPLHPLQLTETATEALQVKFKLNF